jgi:hypothetical protein
MGRGKKVSQKDMMNFGCLVCESDEKRNNSITPKMERGAKL